MYILIILTTIALISAGILFYQYNYLQQTEEFSGNRHMYGCPGGSITWLEKYVFCKTITDDMKYYNASLKQDINVLPPDTEEGVRHHADTRLETIYHDALFDELRQKHAALVRKQKEAYSNITEGRQQIKYSNQISALQKPRPIGYIMRPGSTDLYFVTDDLLSQNTGKAGSPAYYFYRYHPCATETVQKKYTKKLGVQEDVAEQKNIDTSFIDFGNVMSVKDAKLLSNALGEECSGFTGILGSEFIFAENSEDTIFMTNVKFRSLSYTFQITTDSLVTAATTPSDQLIGYSNIPQSNDKGILLKSDALQDMNDYLMHTTPDLYRVPLSTKRLSSIIPEGDRRYCRTDGTDTNCCFRIGEEKGGSDDTSEKTYCGLGFDAENKNSPTNTNFDIGFPGIKGAMNDEKGLDKNMTCPYYVDTVGDVYRRTRDASCCLYAPTRNPAQIIHGNEIDNTLVMPNDRMYAYAKELSKECDASSENLFQDGCNNICTILATKNGVSRKKINGTTQYPTLYRRDLGRCVYDSDGSDPGDKFKLPTKEACLYSDFKEGNANCPTDDICTKNMMTADSKISDSDLDLKQKYVRNEYCSLDSSPTYDKIGNIVKDFDVKVSDLPLKLLISYNKQTDFATPPVKPVNITLEEKIQKIPAPKYRTSNLYGRKISEDLKLNTGTTIGTSPYWAIRYYPTFGEILIQDNMENLFSVYRFTE